MGLLEFRADCGALLTADGSGVLYISIVCWEVRNMCLTGKHLMNWGKVL